MTESTATAPRPGFGWRRALLNLAWLGGMLALIGAISGYSFFSALRSGNQGAEVKVPDLAGLNFDAARAKVEPLGLLLQQAGERHDPAIPSGHVMQQDPPPGVDVKRGRKIKLIVSLGGEVLHVPDLRGAASRAVEIQLRRQGLIPGQEVRVPRQGEADGVVIAQVPPPETPTFPNARIHRLVSSGRPDRVFVTPEMRGRHVDDVRPALERAGFRMAVRNVKLAGRPSGQIVGQLPRSGDPLREGSVVELTVVDDPNRDPAGDSGKAPVPPAEAL